MFDFSFFELLVVLVVALVVLGPTRLPGLVRKVGRWVGKARSMAREFREQLENEVNVEELNRAVKRSVMDDPAPAAADAGASTPPEAADPFSGSGYPYGMPTDTSSTSADPSVTETDAQSDDAFSHAHAAGENPEAWSPELEPTPEVTPPAGVADDTHKPPA
jgi:sec-independent protein translocase protein TatB